MVIFIIIINRIIVVNLQRHNLRLLLSSCNKIYDNYKNNNNKNNIKDHNINNPTGGKIKSSNGYNNNNISNRDHTSDNIINKNTWVSARKRNNTVTDIYSDKHNSSSSNNESNYYRTELDFRNCTAVDDLKREREQCCNNDNNKNVDDDDDDEGSSEDEWDSLDEEIEAFNKSRAVELLEELKLSKRKSKKGENFLNGQLHKSKSHANFGNRLNRSAAIEEEFVIEVRDSDGNDDNDDGDNGFHKSASSHTASNTCQNNDAKFHQQGQHHQQHLKHQEHYYNQEQLLQQQQQQHFQQHQNKTISQDVIPLNVHVTDHDNNTRNRSLKKGAKNFEKEHHSRSFSDKGPSGKNKSQRVVDRNTTHANSYNSDHPLLELNKLNCDLFADLAQIKRNLTERCSLWNGRKSSIHDELSLSDQYQHFLPLRPNLRKVSLPPLSVNDSDSKLALSGSDSKPKSHCVSPRKLNQSNQKKKSKDSSRTSMKGFKLNPLNMQTRLSEINVDGNVLNDNVDDDELLKINNGRRGSLKPLFRDSVENISNNNLKLNTTKLSSIFNEDDDDDAIRSGRASTERCSEFRTKKKFLKKFQNFYCNDNSSHDNDELKPSRIPRHEDACQADNLNSSRQSKLDKSLDSEKQSNNPTNSSRTTSKLKCGNDAENEHATHIAVATERFPNTSQTDDWKAKSLAEFWHETELDLDAF
ncbi:hypothetical protein HELRODRAFT_189759 [Helobdella robusta]|uniref:Uncharacterized protein n=1 Tax=Helobdella robusta TaxID=6412 RepID=T1FRC4_HELRO|nr:hypothetical protein HELRODRAFT_189759 [Helobdella robusta]ESN91661.1 hypothetical protein HELRODRAFT_189759 [Helobdella robusta]